MQYEYSGGNYIRYGFVGVPIYPAGLLRTSSLHLARHMMAFMQYGELNGVQVLDSATVELMRIEQYPYAGHDPDDTLYRQCIGWREMLFESGLFGHTGSTVGCANCMYIDVDEKIGFIQLTNGSRQPGHDSITAALHEFARDLELDGIVAGLDNCPNEYNPDDYTTRYDLRFHQVKWRWHSAEPIVR